MQFKNSPKGAQMQFKKSPKATMKMEIEIKIIINPHAIFGTYGRNTSKINRGIVHTIDRNRRKIGSRDAE